ncbi:hypothetical protein DSY14_26120 [Nocardiopsis sp. MG754419]|nr:hypothetical protein [Nocardiopsis sp. MG754419]
MPFTEPEHQGPAGRSDWPLTVLVTVACLAVVVSGWGVSRLLLNGGPHDSPTPLEEPTQQARPPRERTGEPDPTDAEAFLEAAAEHLRGMPSLRVDYTQRRDGREAGRGWARVGDDLDVEFEHFHRTSSGVEVYRYELAGSGFLMVADQGLNGPTLLDPPTEADRLLSSVEFLLATLDALAETAESLETVGTEEVRLPNGTEDAAAGTQAAHRYSGTFTTRMGGYDAETGSNTLTRLSDAEFDLWIDEDGRPRRLSYDTADGVGETYDYHAAVD